ncbi:MAG: SDR family oxidoreductase [Gammaproteobacteria bacterium]|jgi:short-subunit dehydrogenase
MQLHNKRVILTGASSGIGSELAYELAARGAQLLLVGRRQAQLAKIAQQINETDGTARIIAADITRIEGRAAIVSEANRHFGGVDVLVNNAGVSDFASFSQADPATIEKIYKTNVTAPVLLTREILPRMIDQGSGRIVNVGSIFGSLGFAYFSAYSSSKYAVRGFSEALRRELEGTGVRVTYVAPRAVKTASNSEAVYRMADAVKMKMDDPVTVAKWIATCIEKDKKDAYFGLAESFFVKLNGLLPRVVDKGLGKQNRAMRDYAKPENYAKPAN